MSSGWTDLKARIQRHYDIAAPLYRDLWGVHIHHGYWRKGSETKEVAQEQLMELLADTAGIAQGCRVLDIGCGLGGSARYLADRFAAHVAGINISSKQLEAALQLSKDCVPQPRFALMDAENLGLAGAFDVIWSIEAISHLADKSACFRAALPLLAANGRFAIVDWFKAEGLRPEEERQYIDPIVQRMLVPRLDTVRDYVETFEGLGYRIVKCADISPQVAKTWDVCVEIGQIPAVLKFAAQHGQEFISFVQGFTAMRQGFASRTFQCALLIAEKQ